MSTHPAAVLARHCPLCGTPVPESLSPSGRRRRGRPRVFCSERCRLGLRRGRPDPGAYRQQLTEFAAAVRVAIAGRGLSLRELEAELVGAYPQLASSVATLSAWQTGASAPPRTPAGRDRVLALERCLGVPAGDLALLVPGTVLPGRPPAAATDLPARRARLDHLLTTLSGSQQVLPVTLAEHVQLGPGRRPVAARVTLEVRAAHAGVDRFWYVDGGDPGLRPAVVDVVGARLGRLVLELGPVPGPRLAATELRLHHPLARGETARFSVMVRYDPVPGTPVVRWMVNRPYERLDLSMSFDRRSVPDAVLACRWRNRDGAEVAHRDLTVPGCATYQLVVADPAPGGYGFRWSPLRPAPAVRGISAA